MRGCAIVALACLLPGVALAQVEGAARILDGATLEIAGQRFRLSGIVAPALDQVCERMGRPYPCGKVARAELWDVIGGRDVSCTPLAAAGGDGPALATCTAGGVSLAEAMVASGWALADRAAVEAAYAALEQAAEQAGRGLWSGEFTLPGIAREPAE
jgi:endonuclease YncB( thermonuclease family)